jgi:hypothetical protein
VGPPPTGALFPRPPPTGALFPKPPLARPLFPGPLSVAAPLTAGRAEPDANAPLVPPKSALPEPHPAASAHPATIATTRGTLMTLMTVLDGFRLPEESVNYLAQP